MPLFAPVTTIDRLMTSQIYQRVSTLTCNRLSRQVDTSLGRTCASHFTVGRVAVSAVCLSI